MHRGHRISRVRIWCGILVLSVVLLAVILPLMLLRSRLANSKQYPIDRLGLLERSKAASKSVILPLHSDEDDEESQSIQSSNSVQSTRRTRASSVAQRLRTIASSTDVESVPKMSTYIPPEHHQEDQNQQTDAGRVHAFYYSWWGTPTGSLEKQYIHWNHVVLPHWSKQTNEQMKHLIGKVYEPPEEIGANFYPEGGPYSSSNQETIDRHAKQLRKAGVDVAVLSWYPPGRADSNGLPELADILTSRLLDAFHAQGVQIAFHIEPYANRSAKSVWDDAEYINLRYGSHPGLAKRSGVPILYVYDSYLIPARDWQQVASEYFSNDGKKNAVYFGLVVEQRHLQEIASTRFFDGFFTYFAADGFVWGSTRRNWKQIVNYAKEHQMLTSISVGPGYEDTRIRPWNAVNSRSRDAGRTYERAIREAAEAGPEYLSITSFNEWHEGTQIEPAIKKQGYMDYSDAGQDPAVYLRLTKELTGKYFRQSTD